MNAPKGSTRLALATGALVLLIAIVGAMAHPQQLHACVQDALHEAVSKQDGAAVQHALTLEAQRRQERHTQTLSKGGEKLVQPQIDGAAPEYAGTNARFDILRAATIAVVLAGVAAAAGLGWALSRGLMRQLGTEPADAAALAHAVAAGGLGTRIALRAGDPASPMAALVQMRDSLSGPVTAVRRDADVAANASSDIAQDTQDLSQRTEEQAHEARHLAEDAAQVARRGGTVVSDVVGTMQGIGQSSRRIAEIVGTTDGIALQPNILALNAAVEAARDGEQGRGFAVVDSGVRSLARRRAGVQQLGEAATQRGQTTPQNAALVEQSSAAAESLRQQAAQLLEAVSVFRLSRTEPA